MWRDPSEREARVHLDRGEALNRASAADHAVLATLGPSRGADLVPVCFAILGESLAIPIDTVKPKRSTALARIRNLDRDPRATLLAEHWDPIDWSRLWWVRLSLRRSAESVGTVAGLERLLQDRYPQYRDAPFSEVVTFRIEGVTGWSAS